jgi:cysteinyl-tRNA synthetase
VAAFDRLLGLDLAGPAGQALPAGAEELIARREQARAARDFATADRLREELQTLGVEVTDTRAGPTWRRRPPG